MNEVTELSWPQLRRDLTDQCERLVSIRNRKIEELEDANTTLMAAQKALLEWDVSHQPAQKQGADRAEQAEAKLAHSEAALRDLESVYKDVNSRLSSPHRPGPIGGWKMSEGMTKAANDLQKEVDSLRAALAEKSNNEQVFRGQIASLAIRAEKAEKDMLFALLLAASAQPKLVPLAFLPLVIAKPCPFCGQKVYWREYDGELGCIGCEVIFTSNVVGLADQFNRRVPPAQGAAPMRDEGKPCK